MMCNGQAIVHTYGHVWSSESQVIFVKALQLFCELKNLFWPITDAHSLKVSLW